MVSEDKEKRTVADEVREQIVAVAATAVDADRKLVDRLVERAKTKKRGAEMVTLSPAACALLFLDHNSHNRKWEPSWSRELARRAASGLWEYNSATIGFYVDGKLGDGQHRLAMHAITGREWQDISVVFGIEYKAIATIDGNKHRTGADHAALDRIENATVKQTVIKTVCAYLVRSGDKSAALKSEYEVSTAIKADDSLLEIAIDIGTRSRENVVTPPLKAITAAEVAFLMLKSGWQEDRIREKLALFQTGVSKNGEKDPFFVAAELLEARRKRVAKGEKLTTVKEIGAVIYAMAETERGIAAIPASHFKKAIDGKTLPDPHYPRPLLQAAE
jgi:hypothetical protein